MTIYRYMHKYISLEEYLDDLLLKPCPCMRKNIEKKKIYTVIEQKDIKHAFSVNRLFL